MVPRTQDASAFLSVKLCSRQGLEAFSVGISGDPVQFVMVERLSFCHALELVPDLRPDKGPGAVDQHSLHHLTVCHPVAPLHLSI